MKNLIPSILLLLLPLCIFAQASPLFNSSELIEITLATDFDKLLEEEIEEEGFDFDEEDDFDEDTDEVDEENEKMSSYIPGTLKYREKNGEHMTMEIKLKARGHFRRAYCDFPPLKFKFLPAKSKDTPFEGQYKLKVVTHCENDLGRYSEAVIYEYLCYKTYQLISDHSFDVRMAKFRYPNQNQPETMVSSYAFFIESIDELSEKFNAKEIKDPEYFANPPDIEPEHHLSFFQYMIGNNDWALPGHNCKMLSFNDGSDTIAIPYDFDLAYLSNAHSFPLPDKEYKGGCPDKKELRRTVDHFNDRKDAILDIYRTCSWLDESNIQQNLDYIEGFYQTINDPVKLKEEMLKGCP